MAFYVFHHLCGQVGTGIVHGENHTVNIQIRIQDENGTAYPEDERLLTAELSDHAELIAIGSGSPCTEDQIGAHSCHAFLGEALLIIKAHRPGIITVAVYDENGNRGTCTMEAK